jgi:hypothetical protein
LIDPIAGSEDPRVNPNRRYERRALCSARSTVTLALGVRGQSPTTRRLSLYCLGWEFTTMRRVCLGIAGSLMTVALAGCGESNEEGPISYKGTNSPAIEKLRDGMAENAKSKSAGAKGVEDKSAAKKDTKDAEKKPAAEPATDKKKD